VAWRSRETLARSYRMVVRGSACEAASWTSRKGTPASRAAVMNAWRSVCGPIALVNPSSAGDSADDPGGPVTIESVPVRPGKYRSFGSFADGEVDRSGGARS
jgi:hypothetical protein